MNLQDAWRNFWLRLGNRARLASRQPLDYVVLDLAGALPEYIPPPAWWQRYVPSLPGVSSDNSGLSLTSLRNILDRIAADPRPKGLILRLERFAPAGWATAESVRDALKRFRQSGKRLIVYSDDYSTVGYYVAALADEILVTPGGGWNVLGLRIEATFLKHALDTLGVQADVLAVSPYKAAGDMLSRADMSPEHREQLDWMLDGQYEELVNAMADGRRRQPAWMREMIDTAPKLAADALAAGLVDGVCYFDEVAARLYVPPAPDAKGRPAKPPKHPGQSWWARLRGRKPAEAKSPELKIAKLVTWGQAHRRLILPVRWRSGKAIGIVALEGTIAPGESQRMPLPIPLPFLGQALAGAETVSRALRRAETDDQLAAVVFYVDSRGGAALASDLIWREVERLRRKKPVVVYMANAAASGGYYVAAGANWIVSQRLTLTGSIGVVLVKLATGGLFEKLRTRQVSLQRGAHAGLFSPTEPLGETGRPVLQGIIDDFYRQFKGVVTTGRKMSEERLEPIAGGRVWLGKQALGLGLVDELGDLRAAIEKAKVLGKVPTDRWTPAVWIGAGRGHALPPPFPSQTPAAWLEAVWGLASQRLWAIDPLDLNIL